MTKFLCILATLSLSIGASASWRVKSHTHLLDLLAESRVSVKSLDVDNDVNITGSITSVDTIQLDLDFTDGVKEGRLQWDKEDGVPKIGMPGGQITQQIGLELMAKVTNKSGADIGNAKPVVIKGAQGSRPTIGLANALDPAAYNFAGLVTDDSGILNNETSYITPFGYVRQANTAAWVAGSPLYEDITDGNLTTNAPAYPAEPMMVGFVLFSSAEDGVIYVNPRIDMTYARIDAQYATITDTNIAASASNTGRFRYYKVADTTYLDVSMQTNASGYGWINIQSYGW